MFTHITKCLFLETNIVVVGLDLIAFSSTLTYVVMKKGESVNLKLCRSKLSLFATICWETYNKVPHALRQLKIFRLF